MSQPSQTLDRQKFNKVIAGNTLVTMLSTMVYLVTRVVVPPITVHYLGLDIYGIWAFCFVIIGYLGMGAFGINNVYIRYTAVFHSKGDLESINKLVSTGLAITIPTSLLVLTLLWFGMEGVISYFKIQPDNHEIAFVLFFGTAAIFTAHLSLNAFDCVLTGLQMIRQAKVVAIAAALTETALIVILLMMGYGVYAMMWALAVRFLLGAAVTYGIARRSLPGLRLGFGYIDRRFFHYFVNFGGALQLNGLLNMFSSTLDRVVFLKFFGEKATGFLDLGQKFPRMAVFIPESISHAIYPAITQLQQGDHHDEIERLYISSARYINLIIATLTGFMAFFATQVMMVWMGPGTDVAVPAMLMVLFTVPYHGHVFTGPASATFKGLGKPLLETRYPVFKVIAFGLCLAVVWYFFEFTLMNVAIAAAIGIALSTIVYVIWANAQLKISQKLFLHRALLPGLLPYALGLVYAPLTVPLIAPFTESRFTLAMVMLPIGLIYVVLCLLLFWVLVLDTRERGHVIRVVFSRLARLQKKR